MYDYHDAFVAMLDRLQAAHPQVTFQIDETNDYRMFPFESVARGPSWFQNGSPPPDRLLHNLWNLSPYVPAFSLGQHFLGGRAYETHPVDILMAAALPSHLTFFSDLRSLPISVVDGARPWLDFYARYRDVFTRMTYPLLDDPLEGGWTALQPWDPERGRGALVAFRQGSPDASKTVALRNVPPGRTFDLIEGPTGTVVATVTSEQLRDGIEIVLPNPNTARVLVIVPADPTPEPTTLTYDGDISVKVGGRATLGATLRAAAGNPIAAQPITFELRGQMYPAVTGSNGRAVVVVHATGPPGRYEVVSSYAGNGTYLPISDRDVFTITTGAG